MEEKMISITKKEYDELVASKTLTVLKKGYKIFMPEG